MAGSERANVHIVVLAAGRGSRLGPLGDETPKWLLPVGDRTIAERQLDGTGDHGSVRVVTGHADGEIASFLERHGHADVTTVFNPEYATLNNWYTLLVALRSIDLGPDDRVVVFNSDLYAEPDWFAAFVEASATTDAESLIAVDVERTLTDESMKVSARDGDGGPALLERIGKVGIDDPIGEYVGMLMARGAVLAELTRALEGFEGDPEAVNQWYEGAVGVNAADGVPWHVWPTPSSLWVEIDDDADYATAGDLAQRA